MPESKPQETITAGGKQYLWNRLPTSKSVELWTDICQALLPTVADAFICMPLVFTQEGGWRMESFRARELVGLPDALRKLLKELPYARLDAVFKRALAFTSVMGINEPVVKDVDKYVPDEFAYFELLTRALLLQYASFISALAERGLHLPGRASKSEESATSAGPSTTS